MKDLSTADALNLLKSRIIASMSRQSSGRLCLFIDIIEAYNAVCIKGLIYKMIKMSILSFYVKLISVWLSNRYAYAKSGTKRSTVHQLFKGLPQGGVLCCLLWAIFINDLPDCLLSLCVHIIFADDIQLSPICGGQTGTAQMQAALAAICS